MSKVAIVVLADTETHEGLGRAVHALEAVKEFKDGTDDVQLIFDGAGPKWIPELENPDPMAHALYTAVKDRIGGACEFCAGAFGVKETAVACGVNLSGEVEGHPSFRNLVSQGYQVITSYWKTHHYQLMQKKTPKRLFWARVCRRLPITSTVALSI